MLRSGQKSYTLLIILLFSQTTALKSQPVEKELITKNQRAIVNIGYQIGGHTYLGINYEYLVVKHIGLHAGLGLTGYTGGIKLHMNSCADCPHLNISFKDGNFGDIGTIGAELGAQLFKFKKDGKLALFGQFGYGYLVYLSKEKRNNVFNNEPPQGVFTFGVGFSF